MHSVSPFHFRVGGSSGRPVLSRDAGAALVIVLSFVVLLTGLAVAFLSRAISERQISNSSASEARVSQFADGAMNTILGDLKGEIADGSITPATTVTTTGATPATVTLYTPKAAANAVPQRVGTADYWPNLVKISTDAAPFYPNGPNRAVNAPSDTPSQNGRYISAKRWNSHFLLPKNPASDTDTTPQAPAGTTGAAAFTMPKWILVAADGTNPKAVSQTVVGRYAYSIYNEGGLLDINAAGYPLPLTAQNASQYAYKSSEAFADLSQLTDAAGTTPLLTPDQINAIVGRRNFVSASINPTTGTQTPLAGNFPLFNWTTTNWTNYSLYSLTDSSGFLAPNQFPQLSGNSSAFDRKLLTRQEMLGMLLRGLVTTTDPTAAATQRANIQNAAQYLTTYTRDLNQPSYAPVSRAASTNPRPLILTATQGGNNIGDNYTDPATQDTYSPSFLSLRAQSAFARNDNTTAVIGEPLVKNRFALQRLAWLTYKGPSHDRSQSDPDIQTLMTTYGISWDYLQKGTDVNIKHYFGLQWDKPTSRWQYNVHNKNGSTGAIQKLGDVAALTGTNAREPDFVELLKASIDPGSLAKASVTGPSAQPGGQGFAPLNFQFYRDYSVDAAIIQLAANIIDQFDVDSYVTRITFDDGGGKPVREFRGVENLPYLYRIHTGVLKARDSLPAATQPGSSGCIPELHSMDTNLATGQPYAVPTQLTPAGTAYTPNPLKDTGVAVILAVPELWNPHDQNSLLGSPAPGTAANSIRLIANSTSPDNLVTPNPTYNALTMGGFARTPTTPAWGGYKGVSYGPTYNANGTINFQGPVAAPGTRTPPAPVFSYTYNQNGTDSDVMTGGFINPISINSSTSSSTLLFKIPVNSSGYFREPTMLAMANSAGPIGLTMQMANPDVVKMKDANGNAVYDSTGGGLRSAVANPLGLPTPPSAGQLYTGIYLGASPLRWVGGRWANSDLTTHGWVYTSSYASMIASPAVGSVTYQLQYQDESGTWVTYDEKYIDTDPSWLKEVGGALVQPGGGTFVFVDPRTSRFGAPVEANIADAAHYDAPAVAGNWLDSTLGTLVTERSGIESGFGGSYRGTYGPAASPSTDWGAYTAPGWHYKNVGYNSSPGNGANSIFFQRGLLAQNDPYFASDGRRYPGDSGVGTLDANFYSDADGVVRRAMGANVAVGNTTGQPLATASTVSGGSATATAQSASRPKMLNRPFRSVAELGYVFSGTPWKNLDFSTPESGYSELLDVFSVNETSDSTGLVAGRLDLNTRQPKVLNAVLAGAYTSDPKGIPATISVADAQAVSGKLVSRTSQTPAAEPNASNGPQPLMNIADLVGKWVSKQTITNSGYYPPLTTGDNLDGKLSYDGFSADFGALPATNAVNSPVAAVRETAVRALASVGNTRVWNLMIDVVAQTGRYPVNTTNLNNFSVEGEQRCWFHVSIDRCTGQVIDSKLEVVKE